VKNNKL